MRRTREQGEGQEQAISPEKNGQGQEPALLEFSGLQKVQCWPAVNAWAHGQYAMCHMMRGFLTLI